MTPPSTARPRTTVRQLLQDGLRATRRSTDELAEAVELPAHYVAELISGRRRPPLPTRTDVYDKMTRFLRLGRTALADCAKAERAASGHDRRSPDTLVRDQFLELCDADTAHALRRRARSNEAELVDLVARLLAVVQANARRSLDAQFPLRIAATRSGTSYPELRLRLLEFLDQSPGTLTMADLMDFVRPQIALWDVDLASGVLRVVLHATGARPRHGPSRAVRSPGASP